MTESSGTFIGTALFDFEARNEHELTCRKGEELKLLSVDDGGFVLACNVLKTEGYIPRDLIQLHLHRKPLLAGWKEIVLSDGTPTYFKPSTREKSLVRPVDMEFPDELPALPDPVDPEALRKKPAESEANEVDDNATDDAQAVATDDAPAPPAPSETAAPAAPAPIELSSDSASDGQSDKEKSSQSTQNNEQQQDDDSSDTPTEELMERARKSVSPRAHDVAQAESGAGLGSRRGSRRKHSSSTHGHGSRMRRRHTRDRGGGNDFEGGTAAAFHARAAGGELAADGAALVEEGEGEGVTAGSRRRRGGSGSRVASAAVKARALDSIGVGMSSRTRQRRGVASPEAEGGSAGSSVSGGGSSAATRRNILGALLEQTSASIAESQETRRRREEAGRKPKCPNCNCPNKPKANFCCECGFEMRPQEEVFADRLASIEGDGEGRRKGRRRHK